MKPETLSVAIDKTLQAHEQWSHRTLASRLAILEAAAASLDSPLATWVLKRISKEMPYETLLPGPTGEANSLHWEGRGVVAVLRDETAASAAYIAQLFTALATGNVAIIQVGELALHVSQALQAAGLPEGVLQITEADTDQLAAHPAFAGYAFSGSSATASVLNRKISHRDGCLAQLISETDPLNFSLITSQDYPWRFVTESTLSINTTAVGGNATLLELGGKTDG